MTTSRAIGPPARVELIGRTTHFSDSTGRRPGRSGLPFLSAPARISSPEADQAAEAVRLPLTVHGSDSVPAAPPWSTTCTALVRGSSAISNARGVVNTVPDPGSYRRPSEFGSARSTTRKAPSTTQNDCTSSVPESSTGVPAGHATCQTWYADVDRRIAPRASVGPPFSSFSPSVHGAVELASPLAIDHSQG